MTSLTNIFQNANTFVLSFRSLCFVMNDHIFINSTPKTTSLTDIF